MHLSGEEAHPADHRRIAPLVEVVAGVGPRVEGDAGGAQVGEALADLAVE